MKRKKLTRLLAVVLSAVLCLQMSELSIFAASAVGFDPTAEINLTVPESLQDGNNYYFIREADFSISEKSADKLYIPVQRTGNTGEAADVTLKVIDMSARYGVNYKASLFEERQKPDAVYEGTNVRDLFEHADGQEEVEALDENGLGQVLQETGGADLVTPEGTAVGTINAVPLDENGNPVQEEQNGDSGTADSQAATEEASGSQTGETGSGSVVEATADAEVPEDALTVTDSSSAVQSLIAARNAYTGTPSDRQKLEGGDSFFTTDPGELVQAQQERELTDEDLIEESYPGREFQVHFEPDQTARFLVIDPVYSDAADGDCAVMLMLKGLPEGASVPEEWNLRNVLITDEDEPGTVTISMAEPQIMAADGTASVTVTREGQLNNLVGVMLSSQDGSAVAGDDYSGVSAKLWFPMGVTHRTIDLPVGHGAENKDFTLTISPLPDGPDVTIGQATASVTIPSVEAAQEEAALMAGGDYGDIWNLRERKSNATGNVWLDGDYAVRMRTQDDALQIQYLSLHTDNDYAWDGVHVDYRALTWYSKVNFFMEWYDSGVNKWKTLFQKDHGDCSDLDGQSADAYFGTLQAPYTISLEDWCYEVHNSFRDSFAELNVHGVYPIKRNFTVKVENSDILSFEGMTEKEVREQYQSVLRDDTLEMNGKYKTLDSFSVSREGAVEWARLSGLNAVRDGESLNIGTIDGKTGTVTVQLSPDTINQLERKHLIEWKTGSNGSCSGTITVRPQFDYVKDITVKVRETPEGTLKYNGKTLKAGTYTFHYGDKLNFTPNVDSSQAAVGMRATGVGFQSRDSGAAGELTGDGTLHYAKGGVDFTLTEDYYEFWQVFSDVDNTVRVRVPSEDVQYFDTTKGLFEGLTPETVDGYQVYEVKSGVNTNEFVELLALPKDETFVPVWNIANNDSVFSGSGFCFFAGVSAADNLVTLRMDRKENNHAWYSVSGVAYTSTRNLSTGNDASDMIPVEGALFTTGSSGAQSAGDGAFAMQPVYLLGSTKLRYAVSYNGVLSIREVKVAKASAAKKYVTYMGSDGTDSQIYAVPVSLGNVKVDGWNPSGARFSDVSVSLSGFNSSAIHAIEMNGKELTVKVTVDPGQAYVYDGQEYTENVTGVTLYFQSQITGDIHGVYSTEALEGEEEPGLKWNPSTGTATLNIKKFQPDTPEKYTWGDVLMASLTTDKRVPGSDMPGMEYQPVSTGYAVISDQEYEPETFDYELDLASSDVFASLNSDAALSDGEDGNTRYSFGKFPWLGEITGVIRTFSYFSGSTPYNEAQQILDDLELMEDDGDAELAADGVIPKRWAVSAAVAFKETPYGGVRTMIAVAGSWGNSNYSKRANPYRQFADTKAYFFAGAGEKTNVGVDPMIYNKEIKHSKESKQNYVKSEFGGPYIQFSIYAGLYIDWGFIEVAKTDGSGGTEISHEACYMGAGGFLGGKLAAGYTAYAFIVVPVYFNLEAGIDATVFVGSDADPNKTLQSFYETTDHKGQDFDLEVEVLGDVSIRASVGVGLYKLIGARATGGLGLQAGYSLRMSDWYPGLEGTDTLSYSTDAMFAGTLDAVVTSIDLWSASWPLPLGYGWLQFFQQSRRGNTLIHFVNEGINKGKGSAESRAECRRMADELGSYMDAAQGTGDALMERIDALRDYAYDNDVITRTEVNRVDMIRQGGIIGNIMDTAMLTEDESQNTLFHTRDHVDTQWVAGQNAELMAAFGPVKSTTLMEKAVSQPASQIKAIGGNQFLVVFLDDDASRVRQQANVLKWTVYNADTDQWSPPQVVQDDGTADGKPNLIDAGDKLILSWTSISEHNYEELKDDVKAELEAKNGSEPSDAEIQEVLEADPARELLLMDIFTVQFDKKSQTFGEIDQLTDDGYYDDTPQAVYDEKTGDYIVLFYKTGQDIDYYKDAQSRLTDLVTPNPTGTDREEKPATYSVLCYMLYNNQAGVVDTKGETHGAGWARDYFCPNETSADQENQTLLLQEFYGARFLPSVLRSEDGGQSDALIADLTVCNGYNGLAAYAFTVDKDSNLDTAEDKELYVQFYRFADHKTYVPIKVAGEAEKATLQHAVRDENKKTITPPSITEVSADVDVGQPKLVRSDGSTWLFWREDNNGLKYLNISSMLNDKVETGSGDNDTTYAVREDGSFAKDYRTGETYTPDVQTVDFGAALTDRDLNITDYQVITDKEDNLYVIWTDVLTYDDTDNPLGETVSSPAQAIYATAKITEQDLVDIKTADGGKTIDMAAPAAWSKPYRLTRDNSFNDGVAVALEENGGLVLIHNQSELLLADTEEEISNMIDNHQAGIWTDENGKSYFLGYPYYPSDIRLMATRCEAVGSVEATEFAFSDETPMAGDTVDVTVAIENTGLTTAKAATVDFYEYKDGKKKKIHSVTTENGLPVNNAKKTEFQWTIPADGPEGYCIMAEAKEKKSGLFGGGDYTPVETFSNEFTAAPDYTLTLDSCVQNGDVFDVKYTVKNTGNQAVPDGVKANLCLEGLYGDLKERYGMDTDLLVEEDISGLAPGESRKVKKSITIPVSVFKFCGYDAVTVAVMDQDNTTLAVTDQSFITLDEPLNLTLNEGKDMTLMSGESAEAPTVYDSTVFMDLGGNNATKVVYSVDDPSIAAVDDNGHVTGLSNGTTTLTATLLPSGRSASVKVKVQSSSSESSGGTKESGFKVKLPEKTSGGTAETSASRAKAGERVTITVNPEEGWQTEAVNITDADGNPVEVTDNGDGTYSFTMPASEVKVDPVFRKTDGSGDNVCPRDDSCPMTPFTDADKQAWYHDGVHWAIEKGVMNGTGENTFEPLTSTSRAMIVTMLWRMEGSPQVDGNATFKDVPDGQWYTDAVKWAAANDIVKGYNEDAFGPMDDVTREQIVTILYRYAQFKGVDVSSGETAYLNDYTDAREIADWAVKAFRWAVDAGVIQGLTETTLSPKTNAVRAQVATMLMRFANQL